MVMGLLPRRLLQIWYRLNDRPLDFPTPREQMLIEELRDTFRRSLPALASRCSEAEKVWVDHRNQLRDLVFREDPRQFLRWDSIVYTMYVGDARCIGQELKHLKRSSKWNTCWKTLVEESPVGNPRRSVMFPRSSGNVIHHTYHLCQLEEKTGINIGDLGLVVEFGGGYGSMCRLIHKIGFRGRYVILDLPEFSALQRFYLQLVGVPICPFDSADENGVIIVSDVHSIAKHIPASFTSKSAFIATWSISEAPLELRQSVLTLVSQFDALLIAYQERFEDIDNFSFFADWRGSLGGSHIWFDEQINHLPGNRYLFGVKPTFFAKDVAKEDKSNKCVSRK